MVQAFFMNETRIFSSGKIDYVEMLYIGGYDILPWRHIKQPTTLTLSDGQKIHSRHQERPLSRKKGLVHSKSRTDKTTTPKNDATVWEPTSG